MRSALVPCALQVWQSVAETPPFKTHCRLSQSFECVYSVMGLSGWQRWGAGWLRHRRHDAFQKGVLLGCSSQYGWI